MPLNLQMVHFSRKFFFQLDANCNILSFVWHLFIPSVGIFSVDKRKKGTIQNEEWETNEGNKGWNQMRAQKQIYVFGFVIISNLFFITIKSDRNMQFFIVL